ncbi:MAG: hypothetical protein QOG64_1402 [Acidimicrobiaceae bacterium]|nr:hypothetical protein [Acidimicrobiaceae bacterium]
MINVPREERGPLTGTRVLDLTSVIMGPLATQLLGDLGADVISVEHPRGDTNRVMGAGPHPELSGVSLNLLRNKRNIALELSRPEVRPILDRLLATSDVVVTNLRPGTLRRLGLAYEDVIEVRPDVVYCQAHGFPSDSPRADDPAYDDIVQAASGVADAMARVTGRPALVPTIFADKVCGLTIAYSTLAALLDRERTGLGQRIEVPMVDVAKAFMLVEHGAAAMGVPPQGPAGYARILTPNRRPQRTVDGWVNVLPYSQAHWERLFEETGRRELVGDPRISSGRARIANSDFLYQELEGILATRTTAEWIAFCDENAIPASIVATLSDLVEELPVGDHPVVGRYKVVPPPVRFSRTPATVRRPAPLIGEHSREILGELGFSPAEVDSLVSSRVVRAGDAAGDG